MEQIIITVGWIACIIALLGGPAIFGWGVWVGAQGREWWARKRKRRKQREINGSAVELHVRKYS